MSYTVIIDERERERRFENRLNALHRHCRIGRIQHKVTIFGGARVPGRWESLPPFVGSPVAPSSAGSPKLPEPIRQPPTSFALLKLMSQQESAA